MGLFHVSKYISVPACAVLVWLLVVKGDYKKVEKVFLTASVFYVAYIIAGVLSGPNWHTALVETIKLPARKTWSNKAYVYTTAAVIGTTITPWMQFYLQASIVDKGVTVRQYKTSRLDVIIGSIFSDVVAWFIIVACAATLFAHGNRDISDAAVAAQALKPLAGDYAYILFSAGLFNASLFAASILPLSTAYTVCEGLGFESGLDKSFKEAPFFYWFYTLLIAVSAATVLIPNFPMYQVAILSQVLDCLLLPLVMVFMLKLINKHELMGKYTNRPWFNGLAWLTVVITTGLSLLIVWNQLHGGQG
jgi:Mn2+/Fe2+ NRAMP family transporter